MLQNLYYSNNLVNILRSNWLDLLENLKLDFDIGNKIFINLIDSYSNKKRAYHNLDHIYNVLRSLEQIECDSKNMNILQFSAWFHDFIYDPKALDNESKSAVDAIKILKDLNVDNHIIEAVEQIIISTKNHIPLIESVDNLIFLDADLAILGTKFSKYQKYAKAIRKEYCHLSDRDYQKGRKKVLIQFLERNRIYYTDYFYQRLELIARDNIKKEINNLNSNSFI